MIKRKIVNLEELKKICKEKKEAGKKIVHCHGCFDLLHPGHIRHFKVAKNYGDILVVTVTPDRFVKKGPGRPVFNEHLRLESLASLEVVDFVTLNKWDNVVETIKLLQPDYYVTGREYSDQLDDIEDNILIEETIKKVGGEIIFTDEMKFSSSKLINKHFSIFSQDAKEYIERLKEVFNSAKIIDILKNLRDLKVLVIGDAIIDEYIFCKAMGKPEKASVVSTKYLYKETYAGGSLVVANHVAGFTNKVELITCLGKKDNKQDFIKKNLKSNINPRFFYREDAPTIVKRRYLEEWNKAKLFEVSEINDDFIDKDIESEIIEYLAKVAPTVDMVLIADFGHGCITSNLQKEIINKASFCAVNAQTNSANYGFNLITKYKNVDYISIDEKELRLPYQERFGSIEPLIKKLSKDTLCEKINITLGVSGSVYYQDKKKYFVPAFSDTIVDTVGAGDAVLSITSLLAKKDVDPRLIPFIGNAAGALAVKVMGNKESLNPIDLFNFIRYMMK